MQEEVKEKEKFLNHQKCLICVLFFFQDFVKKFLRKVIKQRIGEENCSNKG